MYKVKNINCSNWKERKFMVIRDCRNEPSPCDGFWYYGSYDSIQLAQEAKNEIGNGWIVATKDVEMYE